jgi:hypothetical protein
LKEIFHQLEPEVQDLYTPTGCWSPTFKASFNDISVLVQYAIAHINNCFSKPTAVRPFYLSCGGDDNGFDIKLRQF